MSGEKKTRFVVELDGQDREIFSVMQRSNDDLIISIKSAALFEDGTEIIYQRYSVHVSPNSSPPSHLLKHSLLLADGREITSTQLRYKEPYDFRAPLYAHVTHSLEPEKYISKPRSRDTTIRIYDGDIGKLTLFYAVSVTATGASFPAFADCELALQKIPFNSFDLYVVSGLFPVPAIHHGRLCHAMTSMPRTNGKIVSEEVHANLMPFTCSTIKLYIVEMRKILADQMVEYYRNLVFDDGAGLTDEMYAFVISGFDLMIAYPLNNFK